LDVLDDLPCAPGDARAPRSELEVTQHLGPHRRLGRLGDGLLAALELGLPEGDVRCGDRVDEIALLLLGDTRAEEGLDLGPVAREPAEGEPELGAPTGAQAGVGSKATGRIDQGQRNERKVAARRNREMARCPASATGNPVCREQANSWMNALLRHGQPHFDLCLEELDRLEARLLPRHIVGGQVQVD
jgi:hypothetical protein